MNPLPSVLRSTVRPLAVASGRVASARRVAAVGVRSATAAVTAVAIALLIGACDGTPIGIDGPIRTGGGTGTGTGGTGTTARAVPAFTQVTAGDAHTCALGETSVAWCWGRNSDGQLGRSGLSATGRPDTVRSGGRTFRVLTAGGAHTCALDFNGVAWCWGSNTSGQLGNGLSSTRSDVPTRVAGSRSWLAITAGATHTCAIAQNGAPFCWGANADGELGTGTTTAERSPVAVSGLAEVMALSAGDRFTCALRSTGVALCWGRSGRLGAAGSSTTPRAVSSTASFGMVEAGGRAACALEPNVQRLSCWGDPGAIGTSGGTGTTPTRVDADVDVTTVSVGGTSACALSTSGLAGCWGSNASGQLGLGATVSDTASAVPLPVVGDPVFSSISVGGAHACAITPRLETFCWGSNAAGQLGTAATATPVRTPTRVP
jgi:alpha-tubulin suppressor-like RCC1 family protein